MHWIERDGQQLPRRIGGHPALDFCNTRAGWDAPPLPRGEWLRDYDTLVGWAAYADLLDTGEEASLRGRGGARAEAVLAEARRLRGRLRTAGGELDRVKACPGDDCGWLFLDRSGRRRWCSMDSCGNRAKVRAHAARHR